MFNVFVFQDYMYPDGSKVREYPTGLIKRYNLDGTVESIQQNEIGGGALEASATQDMHSQIASPMAK